MGRLGAMDTENRALVLILRHGDTGHSNAQCADRRFEGERHDNTVDERDSFGEDRSHVDGNHSV